TDEPLIAAGSFDCPGHPDVPCDCSSLSQDLSSPRCSCSSPSCGFGGFLPYFASCCAANSTSFSGWQRKHCESGRSCSLHQSPLALKLATSFTLHRAQTSSGTPCSLHHQPSWLRPSVDTSLAGAAAAGALSGDLPQPATPRPKAIKTPQTVM